jgi:hypothetical protein
MTTGAPFATPQTSRRAPFQDTALGQRCRSSVQVLRHTENGLCFDPWRCQMREHVSRDGTL